MQFSRFAVCLFLAVPVLLSIGAIFKVPLLAAGPPISSAAPLRS
jgi:hypothetical protein